MEMRQRTACSLAGADNNSERGPRVKIQDIKQALHTDCQTTLLLASSYSGGWIVKPDLENQSLSWSKTDSVGRVSRSRVASAILRALIGVDESVRLNDDLEVVYYPTYIQLASSIWTAVKARRRHRHSI